MANDQNDDLKNVQAQYDNIMKRGHLDNVRVSPYRHARFPPEIMSVLEEITSILSEVYPLTIDQWEDGFRRDTTPEKEIAIWLYTARLYKHLTTQELQGLQLYHRQTIFRLLVECMNNSQCEVVLQNAALMGVPDQIAKLVVSQFYGTGPA